MENEELKSRLADAALRANEQLDAAERVNQLLRGQIKELQETVSELDVALEREKSERVSVLLQNVEISQSEEIMKQDLRQERDELNELSDQLNALRKELAERTRNERQLLDLIDQQRAVIQRQEEQVKTVNQIELELHDKNKVILSGNYSFSMKWKLNERFLAVN